MWPTATVYIKLVIALLRPHPPALSTIGDSGKLPADEVVGGLLLLIGASFEVQL